MKQCKGCPWKKTAKPKEQIPGYCERKHDALKETIAAPASIAGLGGPLRVFTCHDSKPGAERPCVGWAVHQLGPGNNIALRLHARVDPAYANLETVGPQHRRFEDTLPPDAFRQQIMGKFPGEDE